MKAFRNLLLPLFLLPTFAWAQQQPAGDSTRSATEAEAPGYGIFQFHPSVGILQNLREASLVALAPEFSFGGKFRFLLAPSFMLNDSLSAGYFFTGFLVQHKFQGLMFETRLATNLRKPTLQVGAGVFLPLSRLTWFKVQYTAQYEPNPAFSGNIFSAGFVFRAD
jgi:hypothetical protein